MTLVVSDEGERRILEYIVDRNIALHLYTNSVALSGETFNTASFTEATETGYAATTITSAGWAATTTGGISSALYDNGITFSFSTGQDVQGYYMTDTSDQILWAEEFPGAPFQLPVGGGDIAVRPQLQLD